MARSHLARVRKICLSLPEAIEVEAWGAPTFRIGKIFVMYAAAGNEHHDGREGIWVKTTCSCAASPRATSRRRMSGRADGRARTWTTVPTGSPSPS